MKASFLFVSILLASPHALGQTPNCESQEAQLRAAVRQSNGCEARHQTCLNMGPTNPMRELNYCHKILQKCESLNGPFEDDKVREKVERFKAECS